ncbi:alpha-hydroxy-acid oxidizing protein [Erwinia endophytica]|uniref:alpha-hydroxy acid oxidase n=1 Tax=Erwinia endophytica TaxID=1563158 RepID=UPI001265DB2F|nr:alpha-hydroxy acid oxidase [Erwinia endophytica]KAB8313732.1 alpha-hydroxy-acid oxidizing protein [Erwinia endophytica]
MTSPANSSSLQNVVNSTAKASNSAAIKKLPRHFRDLLALEDFERHARRRLPNMIYQYVAGGVETGRGIAGNFEAYQQYSFIPRMFRDVSGRDQRITLFGHTYQHPFGVAPLGGASFVAYQADIALAKAAREMNVPMILSASSLVKLEDVHTANPDAWFQAYLAGDQPRIDRLVDRVAAAGYQTLVVTGDTPMLGNREHNIRSGFSMPIKITPKVAFQCAMSPRWLLGTVAQTFLRHGAPHFENTDAERGPPMMSSKVRNTHARDKLSWKHVEAIRKKWQGNLVIKGLMSPEDAFIARDLGADAVILSNHGGRQLDHTIPPLHTLPEIAAKKGAMKVIIDSGIRRGTDVMKAMALGADFVFLGRPFLYGAVIGGQAGVEHAMHILRDEIDRDLALIGVRTPTELDRSYLRKRTDY